MNINGSPDISVLSVRATFDLSGALPIVSIVNQSQGPNLAGCTWWFVLTSPTGTPIHAGSLDTPDINGVWNNFVITDNWPRPYGQIEWSGSPYNLTVFVQDSQGNQFVDDSYNASLCRPSGNTQTSKNYFGIASTEVKVLCDRAAIFFQDRTNASYKGIQGTKINSTLTVVYPIDDTGTIPPKMVITNFSAATAPISYASDNYQFQANSVYDYDLGGNVIARIKYQTVNLKNGFPAITFPVYCNIDLMPLMCEFEKLAQSIETGSCSDVDDARRRMELITPLMQLVVIGLLQPLSGVDVPKLVREIETVGGFTCDCCNAPTGIIPQTSSLIGGYTFNIISDCGDISGHTEVQGTNILIHLSNTTYVFAMSPEATDYGMEVSAGVNGCAKTVTFNIDPLVFATSLLNLIKDDVTLANLFNSITAGSSEPMLSVDGKCVFKGTSAFTYTFILSNIPNNTTNAIITGINVSGTIKSLNQLFNLTNLPALQTYLNGLGLGSFTVVNTTGQTVVITSNANSNVLSALTYSLSGTTNVADQTTTAAGYVPMSANAIVQNIIDYLCGLTDAQVVTSQIYQIPYVATNGSHQVVVVPAGTTVAAFIQTLLNLQSATLDNLGSAIGISCSNLLETFPVSEDGLTVADLVLGTKNGACAQLNIVDLFAFMLKVAKTNVTLQSAFCDLVVSCGAGKTCSPYDYFDVIVTDFNTACAPIVGIEYTLS